MVRSSKNRTGRGVLFVALLAMVLSCVFWLSASLKLERARAAEAISVVSLLDADPEIPQMIAVEDPRSNDASKTPTNGQGWMPEIEPETHVLLPEERRMTSPEHAPHVSPEVAFHRYEGAMRSITSAPLTPPPDCA